MTGQDIIENKISTIKKTLNVLKNYHDVSLDDLKDNFELRGSVERYLYIVTQATIDLAETIIAHKNLRKPREYKEAFEILDEANLIPQELSRKLQDMVGFRNALAHVYDNINYDTVIDVLRNKLKDIEIFIELAKNKIG